SFAPGCSPKHPGANAPSYLPAFQTIGVFRQQAAQ
ncbi:MAG: hypothetical protein QOG58_5372, partial [Caballeronia sp.]|nr:hypothetical protein [Caballeronia sp.]